MIVGFSLFQFIYISFFSPIEMSEVKKGKWEDLLFGIPWSVERVRGNCHYGFYRMHRYDFEVEMLTNQICFFLEARIQNLEPINITILSQESQQDFMACLEEECLIRDAQCAIATYEFIDETSFPSEVMTEILTNSDFIVVFKATLFPLQPLKSSSLLQYDVIEDINNYSLKDDSKQHYRELINAFSSKGHFLVYSNLTRKYFMDIIFFKNQ